MCVIKGDDKGPGRPNQDIGISLKMGGYWSLKLGYWDINL